MLLAPQPWEASLLTLAHVPTRPISRVQPLYDTVLLRRAYEHCAAVTAEHSRSFFMASALFPYDKRRAARVLYAFCRHTDDIVDGNSANGEGQLRAWRRRALQVRPPDSDLIAIAWADMRVRYRIPQAYAEQLIDGVAQDLTVHRYETFEDLAHYAYGVASTVGLMSMHITGFVGNGAIPFAIKLGVALQITNILRDVAEDWANGRCYLPQQELAAFDLSEADVARGLVDDRWRAFMRFQIERTHALYEAAWPGIVQLDSDGRLAIGAAAELYRGILQDIEQHDYDVFSRRAYVSGPGKLRRLPGIWRRSRTF